MKRINLLLILSLIVPGLTVCAQDILISFAGTGEATTVETVIVENITQNKKRTFSGADILHLTASTVGIDDISSDQKGSILFYPNPADVTTRMRFKVPVAGMTMITLSDVSGRSLATLNESLPAGEHLVKIEGMPSGISFVAVRRGSYMQTGRLMSIGQGQGNAMLTYENQLVSENVRKEDPESKGQAVEVMMQYTEGDRLIITGTSGQCITIFSDIPTSSKTITFEFHPCVDPDGTKYKTVKIGSQKWMAENLRTTKYRDGRSLRYVTDNAEWAGVRLEGAYSFYNNDPDRFGTYFGAYYNWYAASGGELCPTGWHVPYMDEYTEMVNYLIANRYNYDNTNSGNYVAKAVTTVGLILVPNGAGATIQWEANTDDGTPGSADASGKMNSSGFSALPGGGRYGQGFSGLNTQANFWTASQWDGLNGRYMHLQSNLESFSMSWTATWVGYNVRCVRNSK